MASYDNKPLDGNGLSHLWAKIKALFALKTELPAAGSTTPVMDGTGNTGTSTDYARADHVHPSDTSRAPLASPALTGTPTAPTAAAGTNTTQIATTAFVKAATDALDTGVTGVKGDSESSYRTGQVNITPANVGVRSFSTIKLSGSATSSGTISATTPTSQLTLSGGSNVHLTGTASSNTISISATNTNTTYTLSQDATDGHEITLTPSSGTAQTVTIPDNDTTYTLSQDATDGHKITLTPSSGSATTITIPDNDTKALGSMTGTLGVNHGGTGVSTLGAGVVYHSTSGTGALSIATAANLVSAIGNSAVNRATADASGNNIATTYLTTSAASTTYLTQTSAASTYATKSEIVGLYKYKGSVATESDLPASPSTGDVYNIEAASSYGAAGANVAWNGTAWDSLGEMFSLDPLTNAEIDAICV